MDVFQLSPRLISGLQFGTELHNGKLCCIIENLADEKFWRVGQREIQFIQRLDGSCSVAQVVDQLTTEKEIEFSGDEINQMVSWLAHEGLLENFQQPNSPKKGRLLQRLNQSVFIRWRLGNPQRFLEWIYPALGFLTHPMLFVFWFCLLFVSGILIASQWSEFQSAGLNAISPNYWIHFLLIWWGLKAIHELFHGLTCLRYGGNVRECGILFILFAPLGAYVDVTSAWRFSSKWKRLHVTFAGIYIELAVAAVAIIIWSLSDDLMVRQICIQTWILATVATLLFNGNPLIRFDGYYFLSDLLEIPNLYQQGQLAIRRRVSQIFFGDSGRLPAAHSRPATVMIYGISAFVYRIFLNLGIIIGAAILFDGAGLIIAAILTLAWLVWPILKEMIRIVVYSILNPIRGLRAAALLTAASFALFIVVTRVEFPVSVVMPGVVKLSNETLVRSESMGTLERLWVVPGQRVSAGQLLATIENRELEIELLKKQTQLRKNEIAIRKYSVDGDLALRQAELNVISNLQHQLELLLKEKDRLEVRAPHDGVVLDFDVNHLWGKQIKRGTALIRIGDLTQLRFDFSVRQDQMESIELLTESENPIHVFLPGRAPILADRNTTQINPRSDWGLVDDALSATNGGPIAVVQVPQSDGTNQLRPTEPIWSGKVNLPSTTTLTAGTVGALRMTVFKTTVADCVRPWLSQAVNVAADRIRGLKL